MLWASFILGTGLSKLSFVSVPPAGSAIWSKTIGLCAAFATVLFLRSGISDQQDIDQNGRSLSYARF